MADISKISINGTDYNVLDSGASRSSHSHNSANGVTPEWAGSIAYGDTSWIAAWNSDGTKIKALAKSSLAAASHSHSNYLTSSDITDKANLSGSEFTGDVQCDKWFRINAWPGYGTGNIGFWYDGNTASLVGDKNISISGYTMTASKFTTASGIELY